MYFINEPFFNCLHNSAVALVVAGAFYNKIVQSNNNKKRETKFIHKRNNKKNKFMNE